MPVSLFLGNSFDAAWEQVLLPWFESVGRESLKTEAASAVVTPFRSHAHLLREKLLDRGVCLLGVKFLTPAQLREALLPIGRRNIPPRENLSLLLGIVAEEAVSKSEKAESEYLIAKSVGRDADHFLRVIDRLSAAGWPLSEIADSTLRKLAVKFADLSRKCGFSFVHEADLEICATAETAPSRFNNLLLTGFDAAHWPLWPLLKGAVKSSAAATVNLNDPRDEARDLDEAWVGTWEESFGSAEPIAGAENLTALSSQGWELPETESAREERSKKPVENAFFLVGRDMTEQARAVVALTAKFLAATQCDRIGILFPRSGGLPRLVARFLESARIAHNDGIGHLAPGVFDTEDWRAWLELQQDSRLRSLFQFLRVIDVEIFEKMSNQDVEDKLRRVYGEVLIDNIDILREFCARSDDKAALAAGLAKIHFLPANGTLGEFLSATRKIFGEIGWKERWSEVDRLSRAWSKRIPNSFARSIYLRWLRETLGAPSLSRDDNGAHPYARVHLLRYSEAEGQSWSHLIFAGLNEEAWPSLDDELEFIGDRAIDEFNQRNKTLNRRAVKRGRQGEGQWSVSDGKTLLLGSVERRQIRRRQLRNLMESALSGIGVTANLYSEAFPGRVANPTEFFSHLYFSARGRGVSQQTLQSLEEQTRSWLKDWSPVDAQKVDSISVGRTRYAYDARRQLRAFSEYEFALRAPPARPVSLRVTEWESALKSPALVWMKTFLGVEPDGENGDAWATSTGQWVHRWLANGVRDQEVNSGQFGNAAFTAIPDDAVICARIAESARQFRDQIEDLVVACGRSLPDWWKSGWDNALYVADLLAIKLSDVGNDWSHISPEWALESPTAIPLGNEKELRVRGRIDVILARGEPNQSRLGFPELWVIDYKTGRQRGFNLWELRKSESSEEKLRKQMVKGRGLQLGLYALAAATLGAASVRLTLLGLADELEPQFNLEHARALADFWSELHRMQETGVFGMIGPIHREFGFARPFPLATLGLDPDLLREKWGLTHPPLAMEEETPW